MKPIIPQKDILASTELQSDNQLDYNIAMEQSSVRKDRSPDGVEIRSSYPYGAPGNGPDRYAYQGSSSGGYGAYIGAFGDSSNK